MLQIEASQIPLAIVSSATDNTRMKPIIRTFDSHAEADEFSRQQDMAMTPVERLELCYRISIEGWKLHNPGKTPQSIRESGHVEVRDLDHN